MGPKFSHVSSLFVSHVLQELDDLFHAAEVVKDLPLDVVEVKLKLSLVRAMEGDCHELPGLLGHVVHIAQVGHPPDYLAWKGPFRGKYLNP